MIPDRSTRRGFLAACSAAATALGLTARVRPAFPPIAVKGLTAEKLRTIEAVKAELKPIGISVIGGGSGYTSPPTVLFFGDESAGK